jgi:integrase/recombinase XerD
VGETEWLRKNVLAQALPNGTCALPVVQKECPHANACLTCGFFHTNASFLAEHKQQLIRMEEILHTARERGWDAPGRDEREGEGQPGSDDRVAGGPGGH